MHAANCYHKLSTFQIARVKQEKKTKSQRLTEGMRRVAYLWPGKMSHLSSDNKLMSLGEE